MSTILSRSDTREFIYNGGNVLQSAATARVMFTSIAEVRGGTLLCSCLPQCHFVNLIGFVTDKGETGLGLDVMQIF